jgi:hypothetical protein
VSIKWMGMGILGMLLFTNCFAESVRIRWDPNHEDDLSGYRVYWGDESRQYKYSKDVSANQSMAFLEIPERRRYYAAVTAIDYWGNESTFSKEVVIFADENPAQLPEKLALSANYPNPFNPGTQITFELPETLQIKVAVYNASGQEIMILEEGRFQAGTWTTFWDGRDQNGRALSSGTYFYQIKAGQQVMTRKMTLLH